MKKIYVIDATGSLFRSYFAIRGMSNPEGLSTNAIYGFIRGILKLIQDYQPSHLVAVFDAKNNKESRSKIYPEYKAHRLVCPDDLPHQILLAQEFCDLYGIPTLTLPGVEADDTMGSVAKWAKNDEEFEVLLVSSDKDLFQLVDKDIRILQPHKEGLVIDSEGVEEKYGVRPDQIVDLLAIMGDSSDNVPGIPGIGPKGAAQLLQQFGTLEEVLENPDKVKGKKKQESVVQFKDQALLSKKLVQLDTELEIPKNADFYTPNAPDEEGLRSFYSSQNFTSLLKTLQSPSSPSSSQPVQQRYTLVDTEKDLEKLVKDLKGAREVCFDTETTHSHPLRADLVGVGFCWKEGVAYYVPCNGELGKERVLQSLKEVFSHSEISWYGHNLKYDLHILKNEGMEVAHLSFDTILASYLLNSHSHRHSLDFLAKQYFDQEKTPIQDLIGRGKKQITMAEVSLQKVCDYCCEDVDYTYRLKQCLSKELEERSLSSLLYDLELPLTDVLLKLERAGIFADREQLLELSSEMKLATSAIAEEVKELAGEEFNINSPKQLSHILFEKMGIQPPKKTATGFSTDAEVLTKLSSEYPIAERLLAYRSLEKLRSTYAEALPQEILPRTGRIHCTLNQFVAATGRLSSQDPNLQNIPVRTEEGRKIREAFRPEREGWSFLSADYSQIELRLVAHMSEDPKMLEAFHRGVDIHRATAAEVFGVPLEEVSRAQRYHAKAVNFGILYGQQAYGLSRELGIGVRDAADFIKTYFQRYEKVKEFLEECKERARREGKAVTLIGRERLIPEINSRNPVLRANAERLAINTPLQGTAADLIKLAMLQVDRELSSSKLKSFLVLQIHDELLFEVPDEEIEIMKELTRNAMETVFELKVPLVVDVNIGKNWKEC